MFTLGFYARNAYMEKWTRRQPFFRCLAEAICALVNGSRRSSFIFASPLWQLFLFSVFRGSHARLGEKSAVEGAQGGKAARLRDPLHALRGMQQQALRLDHPKGIDVAFEGDPHLPLEIFGGVGVFIPHLGGNVPQLAGGTKIPVYKKQKSD